ncbi:MAG: aldo/keto reductase [Bdellovibrionota bacterium]
MKKIHLFLFLLASACSTSHSPVRTISSTEAEMEYVTLCSAKGDCKKFSRLVMGTDHLAQGDWTGQGQAQPTEEEIFKVLDEAARLGINFFDTSPIYVGGVENTLGKWIKSRKQSNPGLNLYALSKGGFPFDLFYSKKLEAGTHSQRLKEELHREGVLDAHQAPAADGSVPLNNVPPGTYASRLYGSQAQIEKRIAEEMAHSSKNLNGEITVYLMHRDDGDYVKFNEVLRRKTPVRTIMQALSAPQIADNYAFLGWSNWETSRVNESLRLAQHNQDLQKPEINSPYFSLFEMSPRTIHAGGVQVTHEEMMNPEFQKGIHFMSYSPLGGFSILDKPEPRWENAKRDAKLKHDQGDAYWMNVFPAIFTADNQSRWERVMKFTESFNREHQTDYSVDQMINAFALAHNRADFLAVGPITVEELRRTVGSLKLAKMLSPADLDYLHSGMTKPSF